MIGNLDVLVIGSGGLLGNYLLKNIRIGKVRGLNRGQLNLANEADIKSYFDVNQPDIVILTAALTDVDFCEQHEELARIINVNAVKLILQYLNSNSLFIYISSTGVYGDAPHDTVHCEKTFPKPTTVHHRTKFEAENLIANNRLEHLILRVGWLYGGYGATKTDFVLNRMNEFSRNKNIVCDGVQVGNPTNIEDVKKQLEICVLNNLRGIYNCVNEGKAITRYDYIKQILANLPEYQNIQLIKGDKFQRTAPVSNNESATNAKLREVNLNVMRDWDVALNEYITKYKNYSE